MTLTMIADIRLKHIFDNVKLALKRLQTDYIDVLQLHRFDYDTPVCSANQSPYTFDSSID